MSDYELYPRGFVYHLAVEHGIPDLPTPQFQRMQLPGGSLLDVHEWADRDLAVTGEDWAAVVGIGLLYDPELGRATTEGLASTLLAAAVKAKGFSLVERALYDMGGRYAVLIHTGGSTRVYHDAHGNRTVYWRLDRGVVASHYDILARMATGTPDTHPLARLRLGGRWEHTDDKNIRALLPNHFLDLESRTATRFFPQHENPFKSWTAEQRAAEIRRVWRAQLDAVLKLSRPNMMSVTAGTDSRLLMSFIKGHEHEFEAFTYGPKDVTPGRGRFNDILRRDIVRSSGLAAAAGLRHRILYFDARKSKTLDKGVLDRNSIHKHGRWLLPLYLENFTNPRALFYRGNLVETARGHNYVAPGADWHPIVEALLLDRARGHLSAEDLEMCRVATREEMARLESDRLPPDYRPEDMAYWEVRMGRFMSEVSNETDVAFDVWMPVNHRRILDLFMAYPLHDRYDEAAIFQVIDQENPVLNTFDLNDQPSMTRRAELFAEEAQLLQDATGRQPNRAFYRSPDGTTHPVNARGSGLAFTEATFVKDGEVGFGWEFQLDRGSARIVVHSPWKNARATGHMELHVGSGARTVHCQDLALSALPSVVDVAHLRRGDEVWVKIRALKTMSAESWHRASHTEVVAYIEQRVGAAPDDDTSGADQ